MRLRLSPSRSLSCPSSSCGPVAWKCWRLMTDVWPSVSPWSTISSSGIAWRIPSTVAPRRACSRFDSRFHSILSTVLAALVFVCDSFTSPRAWYRCLSPLGSAPWNALSFRCLSSDMPCPRNAHSTPRRCIERRRSRSRGSMCSLCTVTSMSYCRPYSASSIARLNSSSLGCVVAVSGVRGVVGVSVHAMTSRPLPSERSCDAV
mmetsp:Transcript_35414/g.109229  ORF Transcript_35414/g.109229 Transcript_35414/m.109229 type:complete len:204 (-) Transcript_35414:980-1591(-)